VSEIDAATRAERAAYGRRAMEVGDPDHAANDTATSAVDTIANVLHALDGADAEVVLDAALMHYRAEI